MRVVRSLRQAACRMCCLALCLQGLPGLNARPTDAPTAESWALLPPAHFEVGIGINSVPPTDVCVPAFASTL